MPGNSASDDGASLCYICLIGEEAGPLFCPCACVQRPVHKACMARWQLQAAGRREENFCRFCQQELPDWRASLTPASVKPVTPVMAIKFEGQTFKLRVQPGPEGLRQFKEQVRSLLGLDIDDSFDVSFECQVPTTGEKLKLSGLGSYGAATHCAAITAAEREVQRTRRHRRRIPAGHTSRHNSHQESQEPAAASASSSTSRSTTDTLSHDHPHDRRRRQRHLDSRTAASADHATLPAGQLTHSPPARPTPGEVTGLPSTALLLNGSLMPPYLMHPAQAPLTSTPAASRALRPTRPVRRSLSSHAISAGGAPPVSDGDSEADTPLSGHSLQAEPAAVAVARATSRLPASTATCHYLPPLTTAGSEVSTVPVERQSAGGSAPAELSARTAGRASTTSSPVSSSSPPSTQDLRLPRLGPAAHLIRGVARFLGVVP